SRRGRRVRLRQKPRSNRPSAGVLSPGALFGGCLQRTQTLGPEFLEEFRDRLEPVGSHCVKVTRADLPEFEQPSLAQELQMLADRLLRRLEMAGDLGDRGGLVL